MAMISIIIPCYNEKERIIPIVEAINRSHVDKEIIVVDDGSDEYTKRILSVLKGVKLITNQKKLGKAQALKTGVNVSKGDILVFIDSDLVNFKTESFEKLVHPVLSGEFDVTLGEPTNDYFVMRKIGIVSMFTGERAIKKKIIEKHSEIFNVQGFLIESAMNKIILNKYKIVKVKLDGVGPYIKMKKIGVIQGMKTDLKMGYNILKFLGFRELIYQLLYSNKLKFYNFR